MLLDLLRQAGWLVLPNINDWLLDQGLNLNSHLFNQFALHINIHKYVGAHGERVEE